jgi:hypothetical protein
VPKVEHRTRREGLMSRLNRILVVLLVLQLVVAAVVLWPRSTASGEGEPLLLGLESDRIVGLRITDGTGTTLQLARRDGAWVLPDADDYPILDDKVPPLLDKLVALRTDRLVTQTSESQNRLLVARDSFERLVEIELDDGSVQRLYVGTSPSYSATHVRAEGQDEVYLAQDLASRDVSALAADWVERAYLEIPRDEIVALSLRNANGRFAFEQVTGVDGNPVWVLEDIAEDESLNQSAVTTLISRAAYTTLLEPLGKEDKLEYGMGNPRAEVTVETQSEDGSTKIYRLWVGAKSPLESSYVVLSSESEYYVKVSEFAVQDFVEKAREDLLEQPPTPTPASEEG